MHRIMHNHHCPFGCPIWRPTLRPNTENGRIQFGIRFRNPILDPISENTMVRAKPPKTVRIQNWIRNWVAGSRPDWPPLGGLREARQLLAAHRPQQKPFALGPQLGDPPTPMLSTNSSRIHAIKTPVVIGTLTFPITCPETINIAPAEHQYWQQKQCVRHH